MGCRLWLKRTSYLSPILKLVGITKPVEVSAINGCLAAWNREYLAARWRRRTR
jgi:hypothetical protein